MDFSRGCWCMSEVASVTASVDATHRALARPRIGFAGLGWIGRNRLKAIAREGTADIVGLYDTSPDTAHSAHTAIEELAPAVSVARRLEDLLENELDGIVIATPSGLHAQQTKLALRAGCAVFCQKPLARTATEAAEVIETARARNRLLAVDFCYRSVAGVAAIVELVRSGELGEVYAADLVFHNAYGPDKPWFYDLRQSGGGCVMDLGIHLLDLLLFVLDYPQVLEVDSRVRAAGKLLSKPVRALEDHALAQLQFDSGTTARLACSWNLPAGCDAVIEATFYGTHGSASLRNLAGSFYDFTAEHCVGTSRRVIASGDAAWGGRTACNWIRQLQESRAFDPQAERLHDVSRLVDRIYGRE
jgi:predicted dehydrogenase